MKALRAAVTKACSMGLLLLNSSAWAQPASTEAKSPEEVRTFFLTNVPEANEAEDILTDLRNMLPQSHVYLVSSRGAISIRGSADEIERAQKVISDLDRNRKVFRLAYSITEMEGGKATGARRVELTVPANAKCVVKEGSREPLVIGSMKQESEKPSSQVQYIDVGLSIEATIEGSGDAVRLRTTIEESSIADEKSGLGVQDPVIHQTKLEGVGTLTQGKPVVLGSLDIPGTTRREVIEVVSEQVQ